MTQVRCSAFSFKSGWRVILVLALLISLAPSGSQAARARDAYQASLLSLSSPTTMTPGEVGLVKVELQNSGLATWMSQGVNFVSLYRWDPQRKIELTSQLALSDWETPARPLRLPVRVLKAGKSVALAFFIKAPLAPGMYSESFILTAEDMAWMKGGQFVVRFEVKSGAVAQRAAQAAVSSVSSVPAAVSQGMDEWVGELVSQSGREWQLEAEAISNIALTFRNAGNRVWTRERTGFVSLYATSGTRERISVFQAASWNGNAAARLVEAEVGPGQVGTFRFQIRAPRTPGMYHETFTLAAEDTAWVRGAVISLPIRVLAGLPSDFVASGLPDDVVGPPKMALPPLITFPPSQTVPVGGDALNLPSEPLIRVGLYRTTDDQMVVRAKQVPVVVSQNGTAVCALNAGESVTAQFDRTNQVYKLSGATCAGQSSGVYVFRAQDGVAPMEIADFSRPVFGTTVNDNMFRGQLELRYSPATDGVWVINELPIEQYLKGIAETSNSSPPEFQRTLLVAARTYAMYHVQRGTKHADEFYTVDAKHDQVYRGYGAELRNPSVVAAVETTRGQIVTYQGKLAITPYFSRSDGRTRGWGEVWYGASRYPWLVSVAVTQDQGKTLWGHGVGMSASGALAMANEGKRYGEILGYFYQGTELRQVFR